MSEIKIAVIDDGVYPEFMDGIATSERYVVTEDFKIINDTTAPYASHGTICAKIIQLNCSKSLEFISLNIMNDEGKGMIDQLIKALEWCKENGVKLINLSLSTLRYDDSNILRPIIDELTSKNVIIVSAFSNLNVVSWPACFPDVIGVRADRFEEGEKNQIYIDENYYGNSENSFVTIFDEEIKDINGINHNQKEANSYATPVICGIIAEKLKENSTFDDVIKLLENASIHHKFEKLFNDFSIEREEPDVPIIWADKEVVSELTELFMSDEYTVFAFTDFGYGIPLNDYINLGSIPKSLYSLLYRIYSPDVMVFSRCFNDEKVYCDVNITKDFEITIEDENKKFNELKFLYSYLVNTLK